MKRNLLVALALVCSFSLSAQEERKNHGPIDLTDNLQYNVEAQASFSEGKTPLWMNANRYGLSSLDEMNGYLRAGVERPLRTDSLRRWGVGYGVDVAVPYAGKPFTHREIAAALRISQLDVMASLQKMALRGLVKLEVHGEGLLVEYTGSPEIEKDLNEAMQDLTDVCTETMTQEEKEQFRALFHKMCAGLREHLL